MVETSTSYDIRNTNSEKDELTNKLLLLYLIDSVNKQKNFLGITKLQKLIYLVEHIFYTKGERAFNYSFFRYDYGPMSTELYDECESMSREGFIEGFTEKGDIRLTGDGKALLSQCHEVFGKNKHVFENIDKITNTYSGYRTDALKKEVYEIEDPDYGLKILNIRQCVDLLVNLSDKNNIVEIDNGWIETLDILMDKDACDSVIDAIEDAKINRSIKHEELLAV